MNYHTVCTKLELDAAPMVEVSGEKLHWETQNSINCLAAGYKFLSEREHCELPNGANRRYIFFQKTKGVCQARVNFKAN
ncbi:hypothetical protein EAF04_008940 [Stromatinia cepivora]|nr:hypothetical protein EAF04_008940 [Stromatinia cepivora]